MSDESKYCHDCACYHTAETPCLMPRPPSELAVDGAATCSGSRVKCWLCHKPINGRPHYQGGSLAHPCHAKCLIRPARAKEDSPNAALCDGENRREI